LQPVLPRSEHAAVALRSQPLAINEFVLIVCTLCADSCSSSALCVPHFSHLRVEGEGTGGGQGSRE
jgi:hypothetical protein